MNIHSSARVHPSAQVHPSACVGAQSRVGPGCILEPYAILGEQSELGPECWLHPFCVIGGPAQVRGYAEGRLICGARNIFREGVTLSRGSPQGGGLTQIGDDNLLMANSHLGHDVQMGDHNTLANNLSVGGHVQIGSRVTLGGHSALHQFVRVGDLALLAANTMASQDIPPYCRAVGDRARLLGLNSIGLRRAGLSAEERLNLKRAYCLLFVEGPRQAQAEQLLSHPDQHVRALAQFLRESPRGVARACRVRRERGS